MFDRLGTVQTNGLYNAVLTVSRLRSGALCLILRMARCVIILFASIGVFDGHVGSVYGALGTVRKS